jgi:hypothetical protein
MNLVFKSCHGEKDFVIEATGIKYPGFLDYIVEAFKFRFAKAEVLEYKFVSVYGRWYFFNAAEVKNPELIELLNVVTKTMRGENKLYEYIGRCDAW